LFSVVCAVHPRKEAFDLYLALAKGLRPILQEIDGFIDNERFESLTRPGWILSHSTWRDEKAVVRWRTMAKHHETQQRGRDEVFEDYRLRVGEIVSDSAPPAATSITEQRLDETEVGAAKFLTLTEMQPLSEALNADAVPELVALDRGHPGLIGYDLFSSIYNKGKLAFLVAWRDRPAAESFAPTQLSNAYVRHRTVRIVRDYGMFDRRESPQYYPDIQHPVSAAPGNAIR
jgi:heme-degrading monooxygenase HmoA